MADRTVDIAGKTLTLRYLLFDRQEIESRCNGRALIDIMASGAISDQATFVWAGLKHANRKLTPRGVLDLFQQHQDRGGDYYQDVVKVAYQAALVEGRLIGQIEEREFMRAFFPQDDAAGNAAGKGASVPAAE